MFEAMIESMKEGQQEAWEEGWKGGREEGWKEGHEEGRKYVLGLLDQGLSVEEIRQRLEQGTP